MKETKGTRTASYEVVAGALHNLMICRHSAGGRLVALRLAPRLKLIF